MKISGGPPVDLSEREFIALETQTAKTVEFDDSNANMTVASSDAGTTLVGEWPLSETIGATVQGLREGKGDGESGSA